MTTTPSAHVPSVRYAGHPLGRADLRRNLEAHLRRRVPPQEVEDVTQSVLTAAAAAPTVPTDPEELGRWLAAIARNKVADFHRGRARSTALLDDGHSPDSVAAPPVAFEEREALRTLLAAERSEREADAMEWLVREHCGERLADIASESGVSAPVVRQRVSRLRRALRSRWAALIGVAAALGVVLALSAHASPHPIAREPSMDVTAASPAVPRPASSTSPAAVEARAEGTWVVSAVRPNRSVSPVEQQLIDMEAMNATVRVNGRRIELESCSGAFKTGWRITRVEKSARTIRLVLLNDTGRVSTAEAALAQDASGARLDVTLHDPRFGGTVTLRRPQE